MSGIVKNTGKMLIIVEDKKWVYRDSLYCVFVHMTMVRIFHSKSLKLIFRTVK